MHLHGSQFVNLTVRPCLRTLYACSRHNYYIAEIPISPFQYSFSETTKNMNKSMQHTKEICYSKQLHHRIIQRRKSETSPWYSLKEITNRLSKCLVYYLSEYLYQFSSEKQELTSAYLCAQGPNGFLFLIKFSCTAFKLRVEILCLRKGMYSYCTSYSHLLLPDYLKVN